MSNRPKRGKLDRHKAKITVEKKGSTYYIMADGKYDGEITEAPQGFCWKNLLAGTIKNAYTNGTSNSFAGALLQLGYVPGKDFSL
jgi:hypothetical protein